MAIRPRRASCKYIVSACLAGVNCTYKKTNNLKPFVKALVDKEKAVPVCPEVMGGLGIPREKAEISGGNGFDVLNLRAKVITGSGRDISREYIKGAGIIGAIAKRYKIKKAILKSGSPACGCGFIYDGTFTDTRIKADGVLTAILKAGGVKIFNERSKRY
jgi:uncharacterized protein YbbK (DUF523 family)